MKTRWDRFAHFGETECYKKETGSLQSHLGETEIPIGETEIPIGETEVTRVCGSGYVK